MRKIQNRVSYTVTFDVLVEAFNGVSKSITDNFLQVMQNHIPYETTIYDENKNPHFTFSRNVKIQKHERTKTERLFP
jgi:hypothetical protein